MNELSPSRYLQKLAVKLFNDGDQQSEFIEAICSPQKYPESILWLKEPPADFPFRKADRISWQPDFVDRLEPGQRPGAHEMHELGAYYCLDFSSVFAAQVLSAVGIDGPLVLDLCASPGGKSVFAYRHFRPQMMICNETIGKRLGALTSNLKRCGIQPALVTSRDPKYFAEHFSKAADVVIVDAPCSGQSLLRKGQESGGCFHPATVNLNKNRQRRIIAEASATVAPGGYLAYMTCTFSFEENEGIAEWFLKRFANFEACEVPVLADCRSSLSGVPCYRLWPQRGIGAGSFAALFRNTSAGEREDCDVRGLPVLWSNPEALREDAKGNRRYR